MERTLEGNPGDIDRGIYKGVLCRCTGEFSIVICGAISGVLNEVLEKFLRESLGRFLEETQGEPPGSWSP